MDRRFNKHAFKNDRFHRAAANDLPAEVKRCIEQSENPYRPNGDGLTPLHAAILNNAPRATKLLLEQYSNDLAIVKEHMRRRFLWKAECNFWNKRPILVAWTDEECQEVQSVASTCPTAIPLNVQIFVFLRVPFEGGQLVALDVCSTQKRTDVLRYIRQILPNGVLSLDKSDYRKNCITYLQAASHVGSTKWLTTLIASGAQLSATGEKGRNALLSACDAMRKDAIEILLTTYIDRYDPTAFDNEQKNAFHTIARKDNRELTDFVLKSLIRYRVQHLGETESEAFNRTFQYESDEYYCLSTWTLLTRQMREWCSKCVVEYRLDLAYQWRSRSNVYDLISHKIALHYCFEEIRRNPKLLEIESHHRMNMLHTLLKSDHIEFVEALYHENPQVKQSFEHAGAFELLANALCGHDEKLLGFILKHHREYFLSEQSQFEETIINSTWFDLSVYGKPFSMLADAFPEMQDSITKTIQQVDKSRGKRSFRNVFEELSKNFEQTIDMLKLEGIEITDIVDDKGRNFLHQATDWNEYTLVMKLLESPFNFNRKDSEGNLPIFFIRNKQMLDSFLTKTSIDQTIVNGVGYNLLHHCCTKGPGKTLLGDLLDLGFDVNQATSNGNVPLSLAACCSTVYFLLDHGAAVELINGEALQGTLGFKNRCAAWALIPKIAHFGWFEETAHAYLPWMLGSQNRDFFSCSCERYLEKYPAVRKLLFDSLYKHSKQEAAEFFQKVSHRAINCCSRWFLEYGYDVDLEVRDQFGYTPLLGLLAYMEEPNLDIIERLLRRRVNVNAASNRQQNALIILASRFRSAQWYGHTLKSVELLLDHGADLNAQDEDGNTALHYAFEEMELELVELLIARGADAKLRNNAHQLAFQKSDTNLQALYGFLG